MGRRAVAASCAGASTGSHLNQCAGAIAHGALVHSPGRCRVGMRTRRNERRVPRAAWGRGTQELPRPGPSPSRLRPGISLTSGRPMCREPTRPTPGAYRQQL
eukprot:9926815-Alexandrium_andersonii.AAC.1